MTAIDDKDEDLRRKRDSFSSQIENKELQTELQNTSVHRLANDEYVDKLSSQYNGSGDKIHQLKKQLQLVQKTNRNTHFEYYTNDNGKFRPGLLADEIETDYDFVTLRDSEQLLVYDNGWWKPYAEQLIKEEADRRLGSQEVLMNRVNGTVDTIRNRNYTKRSRFQPPKKKLNLRNGVYDLEKGEIVPHKKEYNFTFKIDINYNPEAECPKIDQFIEDVTETEEDKEKIYEIVGYSLLPSNPLNKAVMLAGSGQNGKTVLIDLIKEILGDENFVNKSLQDLEDSFDMHDVYGKLAVIDDDLPPTTLNTTDMLKKLTGGTDIGAEKKFGSYYDFKPFALPIFAANQIPPTNDESRGFFRRWVIVNFPYQFRNNPNPKDDKQKQAVPREQLLDELKKEEELEGLLYKAVSKLEEVLERNAFKNQKSVDDIRQKWREHSTPVDSFMERFIQQGKTKTQVEMENEQSNSGLKKYNFDYIRRDDLQKMIAAYAKKRGASKPTKREITKKLKDSDLRTGVTQTRREPDHLDGSKDRIRVYSGLKIEFDEDEHPSYLLRLFKEDSNQSVQVLSGEKRLKVRVEDYISENYSEDSVMIDDLIDEMQDEDVIDSSERDDAEDVIDQGLSQGWLFETAPGEVQEL